MKKKLAVLAAVLMASAVLGGCAQKAPETETQTQTQTETTTETAETETTLQMPLEENTVPEVTQLITEYYNAAAAGDMDTINSIVNTYDQETQIYLQKMSDKPITKCPKCGQDTMKKELSAPGFELKGTGWAATDFNGGPKAVPAAHVHGDK